MKNRELAKIFREISEYLEMEGVRFKPYAYEKAALVLESLEGDVAALYREGGVKALKGLPGVGDNIAKKIEEYLTTGKLGYYDELKKNMPVDLDELVRVEGLGPRRAKTLYESLRITNLEELEAAARAGRIAPLPGFGEKTERMLLEGIAFLKQDRGRFLLGEVIPLARGILESLREMKEVEKVETAGSLRRWRETIGDLDFLAVSGNPGPVMERFVTLPGVVRVWGRGETRSSVRMKEGIDADLRIVPSESYGAALQYFTGSKDHNIALRKMALEKGYKLSEYGLFRQSEAVAGETEEAVYEKLGLPWIPPELRENRGEIEAALSGRLPRLVRREDLRGDLHVHSDWDGGADSIENIAETAMGMGYSYVGIADHTKYLRIERGLDEKRLSERNGSIDRLNGTLQAAGRSFRVLKGCEANILADGSLDIDDEALAELDFVIAGIHSHFKMAEDEMTKRVIRALENPHVDILSHPTGRLLKRRDAYAVNLGKILEVAAKTGTALEINAWHERLDLSDENIRRARETGVAMVVNSDAHRLDQLETVAYGIAQARRGWAEQKHILNALPLETLLRRLHKA